jgi:hypothetical protein
MGNPLILYGCMTENEYFLFLFENTFSARFLFEMNSPYFMLGTFFYQYASCEHYPITHSSLLSQPPAAAVLQIALHHAVIAFPPWIAPTSP